MSRIIVIAAVLFVPLVVVAAEPTSAAAGGAYAALGGFLGQMVAGEIFIKRAVRSGIAQHERACPRNASSDREDD